jgi:hypothetical protein
MRIGISLECTICHRTKAPRGRSVPMAMISSMCTLSWPDEPGHCAGYYEEPIPGSLWPRETDEEFGFPCSTDGTREMTETEVAKWRKERE